MQEIHPNKYKNSEVLYALPGFCDAYVTLGVNPWGGEASPDSLKISLKALVSHGFTNVESVGDGKWISKVQNYLNRNQWKGPMIHSGRPPLVPDPGYEIPKSVYTVVKSDSDMRKFFSQANSSRIHIFHRNMGSYMPDLRFLYKLRVEHSQNKDWVIHTFGDPVSSEEVLATGWNLIFHPIHANPPKFQLEKIRWSPLNAIYYYQTKRNPLDWEKERKESIQKSPFFHISYKEVSGNLSESIQLSPSDMEKAKKEYELYKEQFLSRSFMRKNLIFGSGTGNPLVYPGVGGLKEIEIWDNAFSLWEKNRTKKIMDEKEKFTTGGFWRTLKGMVFEQEFTSEIPEILPDPPKIPLHRVELMEILTRKTCQFVQADHGGEIIKGRSANIVLYKENPLVVRGGLNSPHAVYVRGRLQSGKK